MDSSESKSKRRRWLNAVLIPIALFFAGCNLKVIDLTPSSMKANPSNVYTITAQIKSKSSTIIDGSLRPEVIIDGKAFPMTRAPGADDLFEYDYRMPNGRNKAAYYLLVRYDVKAENGFRPQEIFTALSNLSVENRYTVELEVDRAPAGSKIAILGRGFTSGDKVLVGGAPARTQLDSPTSLSFYVPNIPEGRNYEVKVIDGTQEIYVGNLRIDASERGLVEVSPGELILTPGGRRPLLFKIPEIAPPGGLDVIVTTDVPKSVIMDRVRIEDGQRTTSIFVQGGEPGTGNLFIEVPGYPEVAIPVTVQ